MKYTDKNFTMNVNNKVRSAEQIERDANRLKVIAIIMISTLIFIAITM
jgi:hypothetical protein